MAGPELRWLEPGDVELLVAASALFDTAVRPAWARDFLAQPNHHLCLGYLDGEPAGFVSGVAMTHPDKGSEMFLYELGVDERFQRRGLGHALVAALAERARDAGCYGMWTLTDADNPAALATYRSVQTPELSDQVMLGWEWSATGLPGQEDLAQDQGQHRDQRDRDQEADHA